MLPPFFTVLFFPYLFFFANERRVKKWVRVLLWILIYVNFIISFYCFFKLWELLK